MHASSFDLLRDIACTEDQASNTNECDVTSSNKFMLEVGGYVGASLPVHSLPLRGPPSFEVKSGAGRRDGGTESGRQTPTKEIGGNSKSGVERRAERQLPPLSPIPVSPSSSSSSGGGGSG